MALKELYTEIERHLISKKEFTDDDYEKTKNKFYEQKLTEQELFKRRFLRMELTLSDLCLYMAYIGNVKVLEKTLEEFEEMIYSELLGYLRIQEKELEIDIAVCGEEYIKENVSQIRHKVKDIDDKYNLVWERKYKKKLNELDSLIY